jgi:glycosyltransferase involved in cell wall biosynthesis
MPVAIQENKEFAGFIITYERAEIIGETIRKIFEQTLPPEKILIVDNSVSDTTEKVVVGLNDTRLAYHRMGYNAGPAGAAAFALKQLANEGYPWIVLKRCSAPHETVKVSALPGRWEAGSTGQLECSIG